METIPAEQIKGIGLLEVVLALGVLVPWATKTGYQITPFAALGLACIMLVAGILNVQRKAFKKVTGNLFLLMMAITVFVVRGGFV